MESKSHYDSPLSSVSTNENDFLGDMIPYRCPKCGNQRKFAALRDLKHHLDVEHSFKMGCVKPRSRNKVFNHKMVTEKPKVTTGKYIKTKYGGKFSPRSSDSDESYGSMLKYYDDEAKILEMKVKLAKETEMKNKLNRNILSKPKKENMSEMSSSKGDNFEESFANVNNQLLRSRHKERKASEARYQAEEVIQSVEEAAENRCLDQQVVIRDLVNDLRQKEGQLNRANNDLDKVRREREALMLEVEDLFSEANTGNAVLREELGRREHMLGDMNRQLDTLKARARLDIDRKEDELAAAESRVERLEKEREHLVQGTNVLLEKADKDRAALQHTVQIKERQLQQVNKDLDKLRMEQGDLVQESIHLYEKANEGTAKLKNLVQTKDNQLQEAYQELEGMKKVHEKLIWQSKALTEQADINNQTLTEKLQSKEEELERAKQNLSEVKESNMAAFKVVLADKEVELAQARNELAKVRAEKDTILESVSHLEQKASNQGNKMAELQNLVHEKEQKLQEKERDLDSLKKFLSSAAEKEVVARSKLEKFISGLINRADKAESELHKLKTRSVSEIDISRSQTLGDVSDVIESDDEGQRSPQQVRKIRARSQDSSLKSVKNDEVSEHSITKAPHTPDAAQKRLDSNPVSRETSKNRGDKNVKPWQKILRKNCLSDTNITDNSELDSLTSDLDLNHDVDADKHHDSHDSRSDRLHPKGTHSKTTTSPDEAPLLPNRNSAMDHSKRLPNLTKPKKQCANADDYQNDNGNRKTNSRDHDQDNYASNDSGTVSAERNHVFHFGRTNESGVGETPMDMSIPRHDNQNLSQDVLHSDKPVRTNSEMFNQLPPRTEPIQNTPFLFNAMSQTTNSKPQDITKMSSATNVPSQNTHAAMVHPPPQKMVPGRVFARRNFVPVTNSESILKQRTNAERSHQLNKHLMDSYMQEYHQHYPQHSSSQKVPDYRNTSLAQEHHNDIASYSTDISSSQRYPIGRGQPVKVQGYQETDISSSQRYPIGPFVQVKDHNFSETDLSTSQRFPLASIPGNKSAIHSSVPTSEKQTLINNAKLTGNLSHISGMQTNVQMPNIIPEDSRYLSGIQVKHCHLERPNIIHGPRGNVTGPTEFQSDQGQPGQSHSVRTGNQKSQGHAARSYIAQQNQNKFVKSEDQNKGQQNVCEGRQRDARIMYVPVDTNTGQPVYFTGGQQQSPLYVKPATNQISTVQPVHKGEAIGISPYAEQEKSGVITNNLPSFAVRNTTPHKGSLDQSQKTATRQPLLVNKVDAYSDYSGPNTEAVPIQQTAQTDPDEKAGLYNSSSFSVVDGSGDHDNSLSDVTSLEDYEDDVDEPDDVESATFEQFMDENGILWESSDTFKPRSISPGSLSQKMPQLPEGHASSKVQKTVKRLINQEDCYREFKSVIPQPYMQKSRLSDRLNSNQKNLARRSKSAEFSLRDRQSSGVRNRSLSPKVRFSDQKQYLPFPGNNNSQNTSSQSLQNQRSASQSEEEIPEKSFSSVTGGKPNFEELWLNDVSIGTDIQSVESYMPLQTRSTKLAAKQKATSRPTTADKVTAGDKPHRRLKQQDQSCQTLKDSSTQTWLLDCPLSLDDLGSVSQRSSFVRPSTSKSDSISCESPVKIQEKKESDRYTVNDNSSTLSTSTNHPSQMLPGRSNGRRSEVQSRSADSEFGDPSHSSGSKYRIQNQRPHIPGQSSSNSLKSEKEDNGYPHSTKYNGEGWMRDKNEDSKCKEKEVFDDRDETSLNVARTLPPDSRDRSDHSLDSKYNDRLHYCKDSRYQYDQSPDKSKDSEYRNGHFENSKCKNDFPQGLRNRNDQPLGSKHKHDLSPNSRFHREFRPDMPGDSTYTHDQNPNSWNKRERQNDQSTHQRNSNSKYRNTHSPSSEYRKGANDEFRDSRYENDHSPVNESKYRKNKRYDYFPNVRHKTSGRYGSSDEYYDSQNDWTEHDYWHGSKRFHKRRGYYSNTDDEKKDNTRKHGSKVKSNHRKSRSRNYRYSDSESDSYYSGDMRRSEKSRYKERPERSNSSDKRSSVKENLSLSMGNQNSEISNTDLKPVATVIDQQATSKLSLQPSPAQVDSEDLKNFDAMCRSDQNQSKVNSDIPERNISDSPGRSSIHPVSDGSRIHDENLPDGTQHKSESDAPQIPLVAEVEEAQHRTIEDTVTESMPLRTDDHVDMDTEDQYSLYSIGSSSLSRTSSQESLLEGLPKSRREEVRQRRLSLYFVFRYLDTKSLGRVAQVCREWKKVSRQSALWKRVHLSHTRCTSKTLQTLARWCTQLECLHLEDIYTRKQLELESDEDYAQAVRASLEGGVECLLQVSESSLKSITIINCPHVLTDKCMWLASCYSRMLQTVCYHSNTHILGADVLWALGAGCGLIRSLDIAPLYPCVKTEKFTNKCLQIISQFLPELDRLCVGGQQLDVNGFLLIAKSCQRLYSLSLHGCVDIEEDVAVAVCRKGLKNLRSLEFNHTPITDKALLHFYGSCKHLKSISVSFNLEDVSKDGDLKEATENFNKRVKALEKLKKKGGLWNILKLDVQRVNE